MRVLWQCVVALLLAAGMASAHSQLQTYESVPEGFYPYTVQPGDTWDSMTLSADAAQLARRVNRMNVEPKPGYEILLPQSSVAWRYVPVPLAIPSRGRHLVVYLDRQYFGAYEDGELVRWGPVSTGTNGRTPTGFFQAKWKSRYHRSSLYNNARMYFAVQFKGNYFTHEYKVLPGYPASKGCVRMFWDDAEWKFGWLQTGDLISVVRSPAQLF